MNISLRDVIAYTLVFAAFFATPVMQEYMVKKYRVRLLGPELAVLVLPIISFFGFYRGDWDMGFFALFAFAGLFLGFCYVWSRDRRNQRGT